MNGPQRHVVEFVAAALAGLAAALAGGCGGGGPRVARERLDLVPVRGVVVQGGAGLPGVEVRLVADDGTFAVGRTDEAGRFEMRFDSTTPGVGRGWKTVAVRPATDEEAGDPDAGPAPTPYAVESPDRVEVTGPLEGLEIHVAAAGG